MSFASSWRPWWWATAVAAALGWWAAPPPEHAATLVQPRRDDWRLPPLPRRVDQTSLAALVSGAPFWGGPAVTARPAVGSPVEDPRWRIAAVFGTGSDRGALVLFAAPNRAPLRLRAGDLLPSGHRIVGVDERELCIQIGKQTYRLGVERSAF